MASTSNPSSWSGKVADLLPTYPDTTWLWTDRILSVRSAIAVVVVLLLLQWRDKALMTEVTKMEGGRWKRADLLRERRTMVVNMVWEGETGGTSSDTKR